MQNLSTNQPDWNYYGAFLDDASKEKLLRYVKQYVNIPEDWKIFCDHMTIIYNDGSENAQNWAKSAQEWLNSTHKLIVTNIGVSDRAIAVKVGGMQTNNSIPHITVAVAPGAKPVESNQITEWTPTDGMFYIQATVDVRWKRAR